MKHSLDFFTVILSYKAVSSDLVYLRHTDFFFYRTEVIYFFYTVMVHIQKENLINCVSFSWAILQSRLLNVITFTGKPLLSKIFYTFVPALICCLHTCGRPNLIQWNSQHEAGVQLSSVLPALTQDWMRLILLRVNL